MMDEAVIITKISTDTILLKMDLEFNNYSKEDAIRKQEEVFNKQIEWIKRNFKITRVGNLE